MNETLKNISSENCFDGIEDGRYDFRGLLFAPGGSIAAG